GRSVRVLTDRELERPGEDAVDREHDAEGEDPPAGGHAEEAERRAERGPERGPAVRGEAALHAGIAGYLSVQVVGRAVTMLAGGQGQCHGDHEAEAREGQDCGEAHRLNAERL